MERNDEKKMEVFNIEDFKVNTTEKYRSCVTYGRGISPDILTIVYNNGWELKGFSAYAKSKVLGSFVKEGITEEVFAYMFENRNYVSVLND